MLFAGDFDQVPQSYSPFSLCQSLPHQVSHLRAEPPHKHTANTRTHYIHPTKKRNEFKHWSSAFKFILYYYSILCIYFLMHYKYCTMLYIFTRKLGIIVNSTFIYILQPNKITASNITICNQVTKTTTLFDRKRKPE